MRGKCPVDKCLNQENVEFFNFVDSIKLADIDNSPCSCTQKYKVAAQKNPVAKLKWRDCLKVVSP